ncbi:MAG: type II toxin-antitoxin system RelE/ParE family toxin [Terriglobia bacterium]
MTSSASTAPSRTGGVSAILALASDPRPHGCLKVKSAEAVWRIRVGDWRVGYEVEDSANEVLVLKIAHRSDFYG